MQKNKRTNKMKKEIGFIGLGKMGSNMVLNLLDHKYKPVVYNRSPEPTKKLSEKGAIPSYSVKEFIKKLSKQKPKIIWLMITAGKPVDEIIRKLLPGLNEGDILIDGGNSFYETSMKRAEELKRRGIKLLDCGVSGGIWGARQGSSMMIGGDKKAFKKIEQFVRAMCVNKGYGYMGLSGAGHFIKGIHNGIEYGMMASINEGMEAIESQSKKFKIDLAEVARVYNRGSIIEGKLTNWLYESFKKPQYLDETSCEVPPGDTEKEMKHLEKKFKMPMLHQARLMRVHSRKKTVCGQFISAIRHEFGGHETLKNKK